MFGWVHLLRYMNALLTKGPRVRFEPFSSLLAGGMRGLCSTGCACGGLGRLGIPVATGRQGQGRRVVAKAPDLSAGRLGGQVDTSVGAPRDKKGEKKGSEQHGSGWWTIRSCALGQVGVGGFEKSGATRGVDCWRATVGCFRGERGLGGKTGRNSIDYNAPRVGNSGWLSAPGRRHAQLQ